LADFTPQTMAELESLFKGFLSSEEPTGCSRLWVFSRSYGRSLKLFWPMTCEFVGVFMPCIKTEVCTSQLVAIREKYQKPVLACYISTVAAQSWYG